MNFIFIRYKKVLNDTKKKKKRVVIYTKMLRILRQTLNLTVVAVVKIVAGYDTTMANSCYRTAEAAFMSQI